MPSKTLADKNAGGGLEPGLSGWRAGTVIAGAALLVFFSAFSPRGFVFHAGRLDLSLPEMAAAVFFATVLIWIAGGWRRWVAGGSRPAGRRFLALDLAVLAFTASNFLSIAAATDKGSAFAFALRMLYLGGIYFGVSRLPPRAGVSIILPSALTAALLTVTAIGWLENFLPPPARGLLVEPFQENVTSFDAFYNLRVSSTLGFPTTLSMYLELAMPVALVLGLRLSLHEKRQWRGRLLLLPTAGAAAAVMAVQLFTYTRSAMAAAPFSLLLGAAIALVCGLGRRVIIPFCLSAAVLVAPLGALAAFSEPMSARLGLAQELPRYNAEYAPLQMPGGFDRAACYAAVIRVRNTGTATWGARGSAVEEVFLTYRWLSYPAGKEQLDVPFLATYMPADIPPGGETDLNASFITPSLAGKYILEFDLVQPQWGWFSSTGVRALEYAVDFPANGVSSPLSTEASTTRYEGLGAAAADVPRGQLWRAAVDMMLDHPLLGVGADQFRNTYAGYVGVSPADRLSTHNIFLEASANTGLLGLAAMLYLLGAAGWTQWRLARDLRGSRGVRLLALGLLTGLTAYVVHGLVDSFLWQTGVSFLFFSLLGLTSWLKRNQLL